MCRRSGGGGVDAIMVVIDLAGDMMTAVASRSSRLDVYIYVYAQRNEQSSRKASKMQYKMPHNAQRLLLARQ